MRKPTWMGNHPKTSSDLEQKFVAYTIAFAVRSAGREAPEIPLHRLAFLTHKGVSPRTQIWGRPRNPRRRCAALVMLQHHGVPRA